MVVTLPTQEKIEQVNQFKYLRAILPYIPYEGVESYEVYLGDAIGNLYLVIQELIKVKFSLSVNASMLYYLGKTSALKYNSMQVFIN